MFVLGVTEVTRSDSCVGEKLTSTGIKPFTVVTCTVYMPATGMSASLQSIFESVAVETAQSTVP